MFKVSPIFTGNNGTYLLSLQISRTALSIEENDNISFNIYPNPANETVWVETNVSFEKGTIELLNTLGQVVTKHTVNQQSKKYNLDVSNIPSGIYFVKYTTGNKIVTKPLSIN